MTKTKKILLGQLAARGDCIYATTVARQIKSDYPNCHLTWAISAPLAPLLINNPYVDEIWEIPIDDGDVAKLWQSFELQVKERQLKGDFDEIFLTQVYPSNFKNFDGTVRSSIFRAYPRPISVPVIPVIRLTQEEVNNVASFAVKHQLANRAKVILFEFSYKSGQSFVTLEFAQRVVQSLVEKSPDIAIIMTSQSPFDSTHPNIIDGSSLSFRENAEVTKYCHLLVGCSSGISWLCTSDSAKKIPTIQLLKKNQSVFASMVHDFEHFGLDSSHIIEMTECSENHLIDCITSFFAEGLTLTRQKYHQQLEIDLDFYFQHMDMLIADESNNDIYQSITHTFNRYSNHFFPQLSNYLGKMVRKKKLFEEQAQAEITNLHKVCAERLEIIERLQSELQRLQKRDTILIAKKVVNFILRLVGIRKIPTSQPTN